MTDAIAAQHAIGDEYLLEAEGLSETPKSFGRLTWERFRKHKLAIVGAVGLVLLAAAFWIGPALSDYEFDQITADRKEGPSLEHPFGTDAIGRDLMVRTFKGGQVSIRIAVVVALVATTIGTLLGAIAGYVGRWVDLFITQVINLVLIVPAIIVLLVFARRYGANVVSVSLLIAFVSWMRIARVVRSLVLQYKEQDFVQAARAAGAVNRRIIGRHILPNVVGPVMVELTLLVGTAIILESTLSFLGLGLELPTATLGNLVADAKGAINSRPSSLLIPGGMIVMLTLCINFLGDGLRDAFDPTSRGRGE
jgi:ABC-type dipeptide/oligopeptide/nickel transport system permease subunit